jgi:hypothetical protein
VSGPPPPPPPPGAPSEEELRAAYEAELARITATDMIAQAAVSLLNIGARRMGPPPGAEDQAPPGTERDLDQVRDAIDAAMALLGILARSVPSEQLSPLRDALSRLQMAYAAEVGKADEGDDSGDDGPGDSGADGPEGGDPGEPGPGGTGGTGGANASGQEPGGGERGPGPAESSGRLWVPGR